jgi:hypothetical protein
MSGSFREQAVNFNRRQVSLMLILMIFCIGFSGCTAASALLAMSKPTGQFISYAKDPRVLYEPGAEKLAQNVADALPAAVQTVQREQYRNFIMPVKIYVCASLESFKAYGAPSGKEGGFVLNKRLFISPKPENTAGRIPRILTHELLHLHIEQQVGMLKSARIPSWFKEGLAVYVAGGGGAETVTEAQARDALRQGKYFHPEAGGSLLFPKRAHDYGLRPHMFYREASMFVAYLKQLDASRFEVLLLTIQDGEPFAKAFQFSYGANIGDIWHGFLVEMQEPDHAFNADVRLRTIESRTEGWGNLILQAVY